MRPHRHESMYSYLITKKVSSETLKTTIFESSSTQNFFFFIILDSIFHLSRHMLNFYHIRKCLSSLQAVPGMACEIFSVIVD